jgi:predicted MarR family transcription regulator
LNVDDSHLVAYSLKKLVAAKLVTARRDGRESRYETTLLGDEACAAYRKIRSEFLVRHVRTIANAQNRIEALEVLLVALTGIYDQATRLATAHSTQIPKQPPVRTKR